MFFLKFVHSVFVPGDDFDAMLRIEFDFGGEEKDFRKEIFFLQNFVESQGLGRTVLRVDLISPHIFIKI